MAKKKQVAEMEMIEELDKNLDTSTFEIDGEIFRSDPTIDEFLEDAGFSKKQEKTIVKALAKVDITDIAIFYTMTEKNIAEIKGISAASAKVIAKHAARVRNQGDVLLKYEKLKLKEEKFEYLPTGSTPLDEMMNFAGGRVGWRSKTLIELYGGPSMGKTQICMTAAAMCLRPKEIGGWGRGVVYIDSEGAFEGNRFRYLARYWGVDEEFLKSHFLYSRVHNFDDVERAVDMIFNKAKDIDIGMVVVDSIMDPLKAQYFVGGSNLNNLQPRQQHLKIVLDKLKTISTLYNAITLYTNHIRAEINSGYGGPTSGPQGGAVLGHASDIRIELDTPNKSERETYMDGKESDVGLKMGRAKIVDCGFLPEKTGYFLIGPMGVSDPDNYKEIYNQASTVLELGYLGINARGENLPPFEEDKTSRREELEKHKALLYG